LSNEASLSHVHQMDSVFLISEHLKG